MGSSRQQRRLKSPIGRINRVIENIALSLRNDTYLPLRHTCTTKSARQAIQHDRRTQRIPVKTDILQIAN